MSIESIQLKKVLCLFGADAPQRTRILRADIRGEIKKQKGFGGKGGDFHVPFWADAKLHAVGKLDLKSQTQLRIASHGGRERLYGELTKAFLIWWDEKRRWRNEEFQLIEKSVHGHRDFPGVGDVRVEGPLAVKVGDACRVIYPYFSEDPALSNENARLGLWLLSEALPEFAIADLRILDVLRSRSFGTIDCPLQGNEAELFASKYQGIVDEYSKLLEDYDEAA